MAPPSHYRAASTAPRFSHPSPTMRVLKIGGISSSRHAYAPSIELATDELVHDVYDDHFDTNLDFTDDLEAEPALTSDGATAPSSSHPSSPSLSPVDKNVFIELAPSSPSRGSFFRLHPHRVPLEEKPGTREDIAAALLSLALPRINAPRAPKTPMPPARSADRPWSPIAAKSASALESASNPSYLPAADITISSATSSDPSQPPPADSQVEETTVAVEYAAIAPALQSRSVSEDNSSDSGRGLDTLRFFELSPICAPSPLPPSSPLPEDVDDTDDEDCSNLLLPGSRLLSPISPLPSPVANTADDLAISVASTSDATHAITPGVPDLSIPSPAISPLSPLSSPPSSPYIMPVQPGANIIKRSHSRTSPEPMPRKKRKYKPTDEAENIFIPEDTASEEGSRRRRRNHADGQVAQASRSSKTSGGKIPKPRAPDTVDDACRKPDDPSSAPSYDKSDVSCPHPSFLSLIVEAFALSRATSLGSSALYDAIRASYPALASTPISEGIEPEFSAGAVDAVLVWGTTRGMFEPLRSSGDGVPPTYFYIPTADWNRERADLYSALGGRSARTVKRAYKQYYWKPVVLPRTGGRSRRATADDEVKKGWDVDWEE